jgi:hypothetical protein
MNRSHALGILIGLAAGLVAGALVAKSRAPEAPPAAPMPPPIAPPPPAAPEEPKPDPEVATLKARVAELEAKLAAKIKVELENAPAPEKPDAATLPDWTESFGRLAKKGLNAFTDPEFRKLLDDLRKRGAKGIEDLAAKLLRAESAGERFLAGALLEGLADPSSIPALSESLGKDEDSLVRRMASHALLTIATEAVLPALRAAMTGDKDWGVKVNAAYGVAKQGHVDGARALEEAYWSKETPAQYHAIVFGALADIAAPSSAPFFRRILAESTEIGYLLGSISALEKMKDSASVSELNRIATTSSYSQNVREAAKKAADALSE